MSKRKRLLLDEENELTVKVKEIEDIINQIYKNIPDEINQAENLDH